MTSGRSRSVCIFTTSQLEENCKRHLGHFLLCSLVDASCQGLGSVGSERLGFSGQSVEITIMNSFLDMVQTTRGRSHAVLNTQQTNKHAEGRTDGTQTGTGGERLHVEKKRTVFSYCFGLFCEQPAHDVCLRWSDETTWQQTESRLWNSSLESSFCCGAGRR